MDARLAKGFDDFREWLSDNKLSTSLTSFNVKKTFKVKQLLGVAYSIFSYMFVCSLPSMPRYMFEQSISASLGQQAGRVVQGKLTMRV